MIHFSCPSCGARMEVPDRRAGDKGPCPKCGQRVEVPRPAPKKTVLGELLPATPLQAPLAPVAPAAKPDSDTYGTLGLIFGGAGLALGAMAWATCGLALLLAVPSSIAGFVLSCYSTSKQKDWAMILSGMALGLSFLTWEAISETLRRAFR